MAESSPDVDRALKDIQDSYRGPGGAVAVVKDGQTTHHVWGFADLDRRTPITPQTLMPICSISKQMLCLVLVDLARNPTPNMLNRKEEPWDQYNTELHNLVPQLMDHKDNPLTLAHLYNMQSGIRDYWAMTTVWGSKPDDAFSLAVDAPKAVENTRSFHFEPGTEWSYSNINFHILGRIVEKVSGQSLGQLLAERVFKPAGMITAALCPSTGGHPQPIVGYEGDERSGYMPAVNRMEWSGDAGIVASLEDMIAYEKWLHESWGEKDSVYRAISEPQTYKDGSSATYGFGLVYGETAGKAWTGHGGALRGFRLQRIHVPSEALSAVVLFNHEADSGAAAETIVKKTLKWQEPTTATATASSNWSGNFLDAETQLLVQVKSGEEGELLITYAGADEKVKLTDSKTAEAKRIKASLDGNTIHIHRLRDNRTLHARRIAEDSNPGKDFAGEYYCADAASTFQCSGEGKLMYGSFDGFLGKGPAHLMRYIGEDIWLLACPRGLDAPAPGDWTIVFQRDADGRVVGATIGCWLARKLTFVKTK